MSREEEVAVKNCQKTERALGAIDGRRSDNLMGNVKIQVGEDPGPRLHCMNTHLVPTL